MMIKRPFLIYLLVAIFLLGACVSFTGVVGILQSWSWLKAFAPESMPIYGVFKNVFLGLTLLTAVTIIWRWIKWSVLFSTILTLLVAIWYWVDRLVLTRNPLPLKMHLLPLVITCLLLIVVLLSLYFVEPYIALHIPGNSDNQKEGEENVQTAR